MGGYQPGEQVLVREFQDGQIWSALPVTVVCDSPDLIAYYIMPGTRWKKPLAREGHRLRPRDVVAGTWHLADVTWTGGGALVLNRPGARHALIAFRDESNAALLGWYLNLQEPLRPVPLGYRYRDQTLDLVVDRDRATWIWKDEDEFAEMEALGLITPTTAAAIRAEGERALAALLAGHPPYAPVWETWAPDPAWPIPHLPPGWDRLP